MIPSSRLITWMPVVPITLSRIEEPRMQSHVTASATAYASTTTKRSRRSPRERLTSSKTVAIVPGPAIIGTAKRKDRGILGLRRLALLGLGALGAGRAREEHIDRDQEEQDAAGDRERRQRDAERVEDDAPDDAHEENDARTDEHGLIDDLIAALRREARGRRDRHRNHSDRIDDRKCGGECGGDESGVHGATTGYPFLEANVKGSMPFDNPSTSSG